MSKHKVNQLVRSGGMARQQNTILFSLQVKLQLNGWVGLFIFVLWLSPSRGAKRLPRAKRILVHLPAEQDRH